MRPCGREREREIGERVWGSFEAANFFHHPAGPLGDLWDWRRVLLLVHLGYPPLQRRREKESESERERGREGERESERARDREEEREREREGVKQGESL